MLRNLLAAVTIALAVMSYANPTASEGKSSTAFDVVVWDFDGSAGYTTVYHLTQAAVTVTLENDFDQPPKELCALELPTEVGEAWLQFLSGLNRPGFPGDRFS
jgi:hypothetical protein